MTTETIEKPTRKIRKHKKVTPAKLYNLLGNHKLNPNQAAKVLNVDPNAIYQALERYKVDISQFDIETIKSRHESELVAINALVRGRIFHKLLNEPQLGLIELTATLDRTFQQLRELQGKGHSSINIFTLIVGEADENMLNTPVKIVENQQVVQHATESTSNDPNQV